MNRKVFGNVFYALCIACKADPLRAVMDLLVKILYSAFVVFYNVFFLGYVLRTIEDGNQLKQVWILVGISIFIMVLYDFIAAWYYNMYKPYADQNVYRKYKEMVYKRATEVDLEFYEDTEFYNNYTKTLNEMNRRFDGVLSVASDMVTDTIMNSYLLLTIFQLDVFAVVLCFFPVLIKNSLGKQLNTEKYKLYTENVSPNRQKDYINRTVYLKDYCKEIHTSNIFSVLSEKFESAANTIIANISKFGLKIAIYDFFSSSLVKVFTYFIAIAYASYRALVLRTLSVGDYIILINAISKSSSLLVDFVDKTLKIHEHSQYIECIRIFLNMPAKVVSGTKHIARGYVNSIEFKNVSFVYCGQQEYCLKNINLCVHAGEKIAVIGLNGAGKTTLVKLLIRLYDVSEGEILVNGINIKEYDIDEYRNVFSSVFQDYKIYAATVAENVMLDTDTSSKQEIEEALKNSGIYSYLNIKCGDGLQERILTKEFDSDGLVLSGGQFQKIAVARAFMKQGGIAVLDEPSSALDPIAEKEMFQNLLTACEDKMVLFISHRLSAAALSDRIYLVKDGEVAEFGTHDQLMAKQGIYYNMYRKQNKRFTNGGESK